MFVQIKVFFELASFMWENVYHNLFGFSGSCSCLKRLFLYTTDILKSDHFSIERASPFEIWFYLQILHILLNR